MPVCCCIRSIFTLTDFFPSAGVFFGKVRGGPPNASASGCSNNQERRRCLRLPPSPAGPGRGKRRPHLPPAQEPFGRGLGGRLRAPPPTLRGPAETGLWRRRNGGAFRFRPFADGFATVCRGSLRRCVCPGVFGRPEIVPGADSSGVRSWGGGEGGGRGEGGCGFLGPIQNLPRKGCVGGRRDESGCEEK